MIDTRMLASRMPPVLSPKQKSKKSTFSRYTNQPYKAISRQTTDTRPLGNREQTLRQFSPQGNAAIRNMASVVNQYNQAASFFNKQVADTIGTKTLDSPKNGDSLIAISNYNNETRTAQTEARLYAGLYVVTWCDVRHCGTEFNPTLIQEEGLAVIVSGGQSHIHLDENTSQDVKKAAKKLRAARTALALELQGYRPIANSEYWPGRFHIFPQKNKFPTQKPPPNKPDNPSNSRDCSDLNITSLIKKKTPDPVANKYHMHGHQHERLTVTTNDYEVLSFDISYMPTRRSGFRKGATKHEYVSHYHYAPVTMLGSVQTPSGRYEEEALMRIPERENNTDTQKPNSQANYARKKLKGILLQQAYHSLIDDGYTHAETLCILQSVADHLHIPSLKNFKEPALTPRYSDHTGNIAFNLVGISGFWTELCHGDKTIRFAIPDTSSTTPSTFQLYTTTNKKHLQDDLVTASELEQWKGKYKGLTGDRLTLRVELECKKYGIMDAAIVQQFADFVRRIAEKRARP